MMSGFEEAAFKPLAGVGSIPFADDDASTIPSQSALYPSGNLQGFPGEPEARLTIGDFRGPLLKSCTESSVPSTRSLSQSLGAARLALRKSRTDGCVPFAGSGVTGTRRRAEVVGPVVENGLHQESSSGGEDRSKSTNSIDEQSVNNVLDQYEELDYSPSSGLSDVGSIDVNNFEATMNIQRQREAASRSQKARPGAISAQTKIGGKIGKPIDTQMEQHRVNSEVEILLRKGEVQKRVDAWLSQSQSQGPKGGKERPLGRSNSGSCYGYGRTLNAEDIRAKSKGAPETLSCDELRDDEKTRRENKVSVGVNTSRGPYKEYLANRSRTRAQEQTPKTATASRIPQRGNHAQTLSKGQIRAGGEGERDRDKDKDKARNGPIAVPTRRSSLKRGAAAGGEVGTVKAAGPCAKGPSTIGESRPNKEGESSRPSVTDATLAPKPRTTVERKEVRSRAPPIPRKANPVSSFQPNNAMYATLQAEEDQPFATSLGSKSVVRSEYATPKVIEKIYERPMQQVIHADNLEDVLRPNAATKVSAYGDRQIGKPRNTVGGVFAPPPEDDAFIEIEAASRGELLETIMEDQRKENGEREARKPFGTVNHLETIYASPRSSGIGQVGESARNTFTTFRQSSSVIVANPQDKRVGEGQQNGNQDIEAKSETPLVNGARRAEPEIGKEKIAPVVNAVLMKTLRFEQDLPPPVITPKIEPPAKIEPVFNPPINGFNSRDVLSSDYDNVLLQDSLRAKEEKLYVTKEEMEHERLMEMLRKGDFEAAKSELERSYTLSTPGGGSPICCPPCSPPPAPTAYISSARASSRRLGVGGPSSPERDPLGRLLRFLRTFYRELGTRDPPHLPAWAAPLPLGTLCPAHFQPHLQLIHKSEQEHRLENIKIDQIFAPVRLSDGSVSEAPRRVAIEGGPGSGRTTLCLRLLHQWATQVDGGSPALALIVPLRELRGSSVLSYLSRELLPRTSGLGDAATQVWRTLHLMEDRVLFVLDGYDECVGGRPSLSDAVDLLEGRLFPDARILVTCSPKNSGALSPLVQRRVNLAGLEWPHVERLCAAYFIHNDIADRVRDFLEVLNAQPQPVRQLGQHPLGWVMLCSLYQDSGSLPEEGSALVQAAVKCIVKRSLDPPLSYNEEIPGHCRKRLEDFGRLALGALREGRCCYTEAELRARGGGLEVTRLGFLTRGLTFGQRRKPELFTPIHAAVAEFLAAYYLTSVAQYANILRRELEGLPTGIIGHLAGLLGPKTHLILNQLCPLEVPPRAVFSLLKSAGASDGNITAVCRLVGAGPGFGPAPNEPRAAPLVHTVPIELEGWARILESSACTLEALEVVFQVERGSDPRFLDDFFEALAANESVRLVRITSLLGHEFPVDEAQRLARHLKSVLGKNRLNDFELVITCLEESAHDRLECVVSALCRGLANASPQLARLVLDMNLSGEQVSRVCEALRSCVQVQALHLPHLGCGREGLASVAELLKERPLLALNLAGSWGAKNEDPSSSGISMGSGSGSGSSGCASSTLGTLPLNRCYSSLPRGAPTVYGSLTRPATLPRLPLGLGPVPLPTDRENGSKRNSDSVLCHRLPLLHPLPTCDLSSHQGTGFHEIFSAIREPNCKLRSLNVSKCLLGSLDAGCLAETIRLARNLDALRAAGASRPADMMPLVLALTEAPCLQLLDLASPRLALDDHPSRLLCHALARNSTLKLLSLEGWTFRIEESDSLTVFSELLRCTSVRELSLCNARLHLAVHEGPLSRLGRRDDAGAELLRAAEPPACPAIVFLRLAGFQVTVNDRLALRGPLLLPFLGGFTALSDLDLSLDKSTIGGSSGSLLFIDDKILTSFFGCLSTNFRSLQSLRMNFWRVTLEDCDRTMRHISKYLKLCGLSFLKMNGLIVTDSVKKVQVEHNFLGTVVASLQALTWLCVDGIELSEAQAAFLGKTLRDRFPGSSLEISAKDVNVKAVKALVAAVEESGRAEVLYTGGAHCRLRISKVQKNGKHKKK